MKDGSNPFERFAVNAGVPRQAQVDPNSVAGTRVAICIRQLNRIISGYHQALGTDSRRYQNRPTGPALAQGYQVYLWQNLTAPAQQVGIAQRSETLAEHGSHLARPYRHLKQVENSEHMRTHQVVHSRLSARHHCIGAFKRTYKGIQITVVRATKTQLDRDQTRKKRRSAFA